MKNWSGHIYFDEKFQWKNLDKAFPELWNTIASQTKQNIEDEQYDQVSLELNMVEIEKNKKPMGYNKEGSKYRMIFPQDKKEMIIYRGIPAEDVREITEKATKILKNKKIKVSVDYDKMLLYDIRKRRK
ncbi:MAG: hypothetical protein QW597_00710 [Thermoplasmataceae archaeon]